MKGGNTAHMQTARDIAMVWDASHIWGFMAWRAVRGLGLPCRLLKAQNIAKGGLFGKPGPMGAESRRFSLLIVPGGNARLKAAALGRRGREAIRRHVAEGGSYLGFCGGAGLALRHGDGLGLCPWGRARYPERLQHLLSGHLRCRLTPPDEDGPGARLLPPSWRDGAVQPSLPVWWPGRFAPGADTSVRVLAAYGPPDADFWLADLPLQRVPAPVFEAWRDLYGVDLSARFVQGQPVALAGGCGDGRYVISYSHLETPHSPDANFWFAHLLGELSGLCPDAVPVPAWDLAGREPDAAAWPDAARDALRAALRGLRGLLRLAVEHNLFFVRAPWLWGWKSGLPGAACNNLHAALWEAARSCPGPEALRYWEEAGPRFRTLAPLFLEGAEGYLLACRLAETLLPTLPDAVDRRGLANQREALFGHPMNGGGLAGQLTDIAEELFFLCHAPTGA